MPMSNQAAAAPYVVRRRWTITDARAAIAALTASGLSLVAFAQREGLEVERLRRWRARLAAEQRGAAPVAAPAAPEVIELRARPATPVEIVLGSGRILRVAETIDVVVLARLVAALERA
jgi:transposase-like protein